ncbi:MAG: LysR family transcriptional regulator [Pseudomonadota bacterium]
MRNLTIYRYVDHVARAGSIRKAAEGLNITPSALNRRIQSFEDEVGFPIFERISMGVRLNAAGELIIGHVRNQLADMERVRSRIADLEGNRRGHIPIACSQALLPYFLPDQISQYRSAYPAVTFSVLPRDREAAERALMDYNVDLALVFEPVLMAELRPLALVRQSVHAVMAANHPLAGETVVRLRDCLQHPLCLPTAPYGVRNLLRQATARRAEPLRPVVESDSFEFLRHAIGDGESISFQIEIGLRSAAGGAIVHRPVDERDLPSGVLVLGQLRNRVLPVASARFADQLVNCFQTRFECV